MGAGQVLSDLVNGLGGRYRGPGIASAVADAHIPDGSPASPPLKRVQTTASMWISPIAKISMGLRPAGRARLPGWCRPALGELRAQLCPKAQIRQTDAVLSLALNAGVRNCRTHEFQERGCRQWPAPSKPDAENPRYLSHLRADMGIRTVCASGFCPPAMPGGEASWRRARAALAGFVRLSR